MQVEITTNERGLEMTWEANLDADGVLRWTSNDQVPFPDMVEKFIEAGYPASLEACKAAREADCAAFAKRYREMRAREGYSAEERFEMRAAFGEGETVVDVVTGEKIRL